MLSVMTAALLAIHLMMVSLLAAILLGPPTRGHSELGPCYNAEIYANANGARYFQIAIGSVYVA